MDGRITSCLGTLTYAEHLSLFEGRNALDRELLRIWMEESMLVNEHSERHGNGTFIYLSGNTYVGEWKKDYDGQGTLTMQMEALILVNG